MSGIDLYASVHKAQRARLFSLVVEAGKVDASDERGVEAVAGAVRALVRDLRCHAEHEERFIHPLLRDGVRMLHSVQQDKSEGAAGIAEQLEAEHVELDEQLRELQAAAASAGIYRALARFTARYLEHLDAEESVAMPALRESCSEAELGQVMVAFRESRSEVENLTSAVSQLPTLSPSERAQFVAMALGEYRRAELSELFGALLSPAQFGLLPA